MVAVSRNASTTFTFARKTTLSSDLRAKLRAAETRATRAEQGQGHSDERLRQALSQHEKELRQLKEERRHQGQQHEELQQQSASIRKEQRQAEDSAFRPAEETIRSLPRPEGRWSDLSPEQLEMWVATCLAIGYDSNEALWDDRMEELSRASRMQSRKDVSRRQGKRGGGWS